MVKLGVLGTGFIANIFMKSLSEINGLEVEAVLGVDLEEVKDFAKKYNIPNAYINYDEMLENEEIQLIYVALPNHLHYSFAKKALSNGKHVVVEKPFVASDKEVTDLVNTAKANNVMLFDAITTKYTPLLDNIRENLSRVEEIKNVTSSYCQYSSKFDLVKIGEIPAVFDLAKDGGALKDLGIYPVTFMVVLFGKPQSVQYYANKLENGCDTSGVLIMKYSNFIGTLRIAKDSFSDNRCTIEGTGGTIFVDDDCFRFPNARLQEKKTSDSEILGELKTSGIVNEFNCFVNLIESKDYNKCYMLLEQTKVVMQVMSDAASSAGITYGNV